MSMKNLAPSLVLLATPAGAQDAGSELRKELDEGLQHCVDWYKDNLPLTSTIVL